MADAAATSSSSGAPQRPVQVKLVLLGEAAVGKSSVVLRFVQNDFQENKEPTIGAAFLTQKCRLEDKVIKFEIWDTAGQERFHSLAPMYYRNAAAAIVVYDVTKASSLEKAKSWVKELQRQANSNIVIAFVGNKLDLVQGGASDAGDDADDDNEDDDDDDDDDASEADDATARGAAARADGGDGASEAGEGASSTRSKTRAGSGSGYGSGSAASKRQVPRAEAEAYAKEANLLFAETSAKTGEGVVEVFTEIAKTIPLDALLANSRQGGAAGGRAGGAAARAGAGGAAGAGQAQAGDRVDLTSGPGAKDGACAC